MGKSKKQSAATATVEESAMAAPEQATAVPKQQNSIAAEQPQDLDASSAAAYLWLLVFSVLMFTFPFITFYGVRSWLQDAYDFSSFHTNCFSVLASVIVTNFIIMMYVFMAFTEGKQKPAKPSKKSQ